MTADVERIEQCLFGGRLIGELRYSTLLEPSGHTSPAGTAAIATDGCTF